ncbi:MAG: M36 family metallopeptidase [Polyangiaceae bacterium]
MSASGATILRSPSGRLTAPSADDAATVSTDFLLSRGAIARVDQIATETVSAGRGGVSHVRLTQTAGGLRVHNTYAKIAVSDKGEVLQAIYRLAFTHDEPEAASINEREALNAAMGELGYGEAPGPEHVRGNFTSFAATTELYRDPQVERVAYVDAGGRMRVGFVVETWSNIGNQLDYTLVGGDGSIVSVELRTANDSYKVFVEDPLKGAQTVVSGPGAGNAQSPSGWLGAGAQTTVNISGNNVKAYLDTDANNSPDSGGTSVTTGNFTTTVDLASSPSTTGNKNVAVQNLFFLNNVLHDRLYSVGFIESTGNFQVNNFGNGGSGNDPVLAEAQDGSGTDNANFATPSGRQLAPHADVPGAAPRRTAS